MKMRNSICGIALLCFAFASCADEQDASSEHPAEGMTSVQFTFSSSSMDVLTDTRTAIPSSGKSSCMDVSMGGDEEVATRATVGEAPDEKKITNLCVFQFDGPTLVYSQFITAIIEADGKKKAEAYLRMNDNVNTVYVVANMGNITSNFPINTTTLTEFEAEKKCKLDVTMAQGLPMIGAHKEVKLATMEEIPVTLDYMVAKVSFTSANLVSPDKGKLEYTSVRLRNVPSKTFLLPKTTTTAPTDVVNLPTLPYQAGDIQVWYVLESRSGEGTDITTQEDRWKENAPDSAMYVEVKAKLTFAGDDVPTEMVYEVYLGNGTVTDFTVERQKRYVVNANIKGASAVDGRVLMGDDLSGDGEKTANCYVALQPNHWYRFDPTVQGNGKTVAFTPSADVVGNSATPRTGMKPYDAFLIWQTSSVEGDGGAGTVLGTVELTKRKHIRFKTTSVREGNAVIGMREEGMPAGEVAWSWHIWVTASDPALGSDIYKIRNNLTAAFLTRTEISMNRNLGAANNSPTDPLSGGLLYQWGRKDPFTGSANYLTASTVPTSTVVYSTDFVWKDGSAPHGAAVVAVGEGAAAVAYAVKHPTWYLLQKNNTTNDWVAAARDNMDDNLWGNPNATPVPSEKQLPNQSRGSKSMYDPCPFGWRAAPQDTWTAFTTTGNNIGNFPAQWNVSGGFNKGWNFYFEGNKPTGRTTFFPASGYRRMESGGVLANVGTYGFSWASSTYGAGSINGSYLIFNSTNVNPFNSQSRSYGISVRCVRE